MMQIEVCTKTHDARQRVWDAKAEGRKVGLVPTMGALHEGHLSLVKASAALCEFTAVSVFVNTTQFGPGEDFDNYPRDLTRDLELLDGMGVNLIFAPLTDEFYRERHSTFIDPPAVAAPLEGQLRPGHFRGVATIVLKLLNVLPADMAYFGQKDFQQVRVIQDMVADLDLPVGIQVCPIIRDADGLALSSRNAYLSDAERARALCLSLALRRAVDLVRAGEKLASVICSQMREILEPAVDQIDYATLADPVTLREVEFVQRETVALVAARIGETRLIDNAYLP